MVLKDKEQRLEKIIMAIKNETDEKAEEILEDAKRKMDKERNKIFNIKKENLNFEYNKKKEQEETNAKLHKSRIHNSSNLEIQKDRNTLVEKIKTDLIDEMKKIFNDDNKYKQFLKNLILQGMVRLLEKEIKIKVRKEDYEYIKNNLNAIEDDFKNFMKEKTKKDMSTKLVLIDNDYLTEQDIGGVIMYCNKNKIVFKNTISVRAEICFQDSIPQLRNILFPNLLK